MRTLDRNGLIGVLPILLQKLGELSPSLNEFFIAFLSKSCHLTMTMSSVALKLVTIALAEREF